ncbi:MAG: TonB-dependent receptor, partial [Flavobacteriales bacterium]
VPFQLISDHYLSIENKLIFDKSVLKLLTGYTSNSLTEHEEKVTIPGIKMLLTNIPYNLSFSTNINEHLKWISGAQGMIVKNKNDRSAENILLPNSSSIDYGTYSLFQFSKELFETQIGVRYDYREINADEIGSKNFSKLNGSVGLVYQTGLYTFRTNFSSGFRPPHISEMLADGVHHGTNRYEIGSQDLESEYANQLDFSLDYNTAHLNVNINPFYNTFKNYIYIKPTEEIIDGYENYPVYRYAQTSSATTYGTEIYFHYHPHFAHRLHLEQDFSFVMGEDQYNQPLPLIPQTRINTNLKYEFGEQKAKIKIETLQLQRTHFLDKNEVASFETTSNDYEIYNLEANFSYTSKKTVYLKLGIRNIFNKRYVNHLSNLKNIRLPGAGTNVYFAINYILN